MKTKTKTSAPIFDALDFPLESFVLFKDGRQWKRVAQDRKALYVQIAKHGEKAWPGVNGLMRKTGFSRAKVFRLLTDLKELGCIADARPTARDGNTPVSTARVCALLTTELCSDRVRRQVGSRLRTRVS
jgi:hypothetical protein